MVKEMEKKEDGEGIDVEEEIKGCNKGGAVVGGGGEGDGARGGGGG